MENVKCLVIGDSGVGKSSLIMRYTNSNHGRPILYGMKTKSINIGDTCINITIWDTLGGADFTTLRPPMYTSGLNGVQRLQPLVYPNTSVFLICFSVIEPTSYENVLEKWFPGVNEYCPDAEVVLVGTNMDLRDNTEVVHRLKGMGMCPITRKDGVKLKKALKCAKYVECGMNSDIQCVFQHAINAVLFRRKLKMKM